LAGGRDSPGGAAFFQFAENAKLASQLTRSPGIAFKRLIFAAA